LGDVARATLVSSSSGIHHAVGTILTEVALDLLMLGVVTVFLLGQVSLADWWRVPGQVTVTSAAVAAVLLALILAFRRPLTAGLDRLTDRLDQTLPGRVLCHISQLMESLNGLTLKTLASAMLCSGLIWVLYAAVNLVLMPAVGIQPSALSSLFVLAVLLVGVAVPSSPGRIGVFHYLCAQALAVFGVDQASALSYAIVLHLITVVLPALLGALLSWSFGVSLVRPSLQEEATP
jgi:uncharacterized protein (TIRG00374 family)